MRTRTIVFLVVLSACGTWYPSAATATPILDQSNVGAVENGFIVSFEQNLAQTFTVGVSGILSEFAIDVGDREIGGSPLVWSIRRGLFSGTLATGVLTHDDVPFKPSFPPGGPFPPVDLTHVDVSSFGVRVSEGEQLYLYLDTGDSETLFGNCFPYCWTFNSSRYPRGEGILIIRGVPSSFETGDFLFQTYVDPGPSPTPVPEPSTLLLCGTMAGLGMAARWRKRWTQ
jgi:PEP-CTERM motif-containing protein